MLKQCFCQYGQDDERCCINQDKTKLNMGWECPVCFSGNAPWMPYCDTCKKNEDKMKSNPKEDQL